MLKEPCRLLGFPASRLANPCSPTLTRRRRLDLGLGLLGISSCKNVWGRVFSPLNLALKGIETLDILLLQGAGRTA